MSPVRPRSPAPNKSCLRYTSPTISAGQKQTSPAEARYPSGKGEVCKTFMRRFDPDPRLQAFSGKELSSLGVSSSVQFVPYRARWLTMTEFRIRERRLHGARKDGASRRSPGVEPPHILPATTMP